MVHAITNCWEAFNGGPRPIWEPSVYQKLRETYVQVVGEDNSSVNLTAASSFKAPWHVKHHSEKGRALYASSDIQAGEEIWDTSSSAVFYDQDEFQEFLNLIGYDLACDILQWAYVESYEEEDDEYYYVGVELGEGSLMNEISKGEIRNAGWCATDQVLKCEDAGATYAIQDIKKGDEVVSDYSLFHHDDGVVWFDELEHAAWRSFLDEEESGNDEL